MASTAISAQGSTLHIGADDTAVTITDITNANPGVFEVVAHGLTSGTVGAVDSVTGMTEVNGKYGVITVIDADHFSIAGLDTTDFTAYASGGSLTPTKTKLGNFTNYNLPGAAKPEIDITNFDSTSKEYIPGLRDNGEMSIGIDIDQDDPGQQVLRSSNAASGGGSLSLFLFTLPNGKTRSFYGFVKQYGEQAGVDQKLAGTVNIRISGDVTFG